MSRLGLPQIFTVVLLIPFIPLASQVAASQGLSLAAPSPLVLTDDQGEYPMGSHLEVLEDPSRELTFEEVSSPSYNDKFVPSEAQVPVYGFTDSAYWARIKLRNESRTDSWFLDVLYSNLQYIDLYTPRPDSDEYALRQTGSLRPPPTRDLRYPRSVFTLTLPPQSQETIYMRFQSGTSMTLNLKLWSQSAFFNYAIQEQISFGLFFGVLIGLFFYNLFLLFTIKESNYLYFVFLLGSMILHEASYSGYLETYLIPGLYAFKRYYHPFLFSLMVISLILFADSFLEFRQRSPTLHRITIASAICCGILILLIPFVNYRIIAVLLLVWAFLSLLAVLTGGVLSYARGVFRPTSLFMIAWFSMVALLLDLLLVRLGITPSTVFSENTYRFGTLMVAILWSFSLAERVNLLKAETENVNRQLQESEHSLSQILDGMPFGVVLYTNENKPKYGNRTWFEILTDPARDIRPDLSSGRTLAEAIQYYSLKTAGSSELYPLENFPAFQALQGQPAYADDIEMHRGDQIIPLEMWASPILSESGQVESAVVVFQDISQRKMAEDLLLEYRKHLESLVEIRTEDLNAANKELRLRLEWLAAVNLVNQMIARSADFTEIYESIVKIVNHLFDSQDSFIAELDTENNQFRILSHSGSRLQPDLIGSSTTLPKWGSLEADQEHGKIIMISKDEFGSLSGPLSRHVQTLEVQGIAVILLQVREQILGLLGLEMHEQGRTITSEESNLLSIFSTDIAQLIEDARLFEQAKLLVVAEERNRLARELHDSVAQTLYSISLFINATRLALKTNKPQVVENHLEELTQLSREAMSDMRLLIFELRPPILEKSGLVTALQSRLESVEGKSGFQTHFESEGVFHLSPAQESELYRIAQEALNNVIKHAQANQVKVQLIGEVSCVRLTVEDDGIGFDPPSIEHKGGQGFRNMLERAAKIGAKCSFDSVPEHGTKITVEVNQ